MMKRTFALLAALVVLAACRGQERIVEAGDSALSVKNGILLYANQPFTGIVRSTIPALEEVELTAYRLGIQHGVTRKHTLDGKLLAEWPYLAGAKHGIHKTWDRNGQLRTYTRFERGDYAGEAWSWYPDGKPYDYRKYNEKGELMIARRWRQTGQIYLNQVFQNGAAIGMPGSKLCDPTGVETAEAKKLAEERGGVP